MRQTAEPNPPYRAGRAGPDERIATSDEVRLRPPKPERDNPLKAPLALLDVADSSVTDTLGIVVRYVKDLPAEFLLDFAEHFDARLIDDLTVLHGALEKLRENQLPTQDEIDLLSDPRELFDSFPDHLRYLARRYTVAENLRVFVENQLASPLEALSTCLLTDPAMRGIIRLWEEAVYPDAEAPDFGSRCP